MRSKLRGFLSSFLSPTSFFKATKGAGVPKKKEETGHWKVKSFGMSGEEGVTSIPKDFHNTTTVSDIERERQVYLSLWPESKSSDSSLSGEPAFVSGFPPAVFYWP